MATQPPLGWIKPEDRTQAQQDAHNAAVAKMAKFAIQFTDPGPVKVILTNFWRDPKVLADVGEEFTGFHQLTGSCVGVSDGDAVFTLAAIQRTIATNPTKAFVPFWPFNYGRTRFLEGDRGQGEGAVDSVMATQNGKEGIFDIGQPGLPAFTKTDGWFLPAKTEMQWSDGGSAIVTKWLPTAAPHPVGTRAVLNNVADIRAAVINGYPVLDGCNNYVGHGSIKGSGANAYVVGRYDAAGGHSTCILGYWDHPTDGPLYLYSNQWPTSTYPKDPAGGGRCTVWIPESEMAKLFKTGGSGGETVALSSLNWFPAQVDEIADYTP